MSALSKAVRISLFFIVVIFFTFIVLPVNAGSSESAKAQKSDLEAQSAEIKTEAAVAMDISLNALSNVIAAFNDTEKKITVKLYAGDASDVKSMIKLLGSAWKSEEDVLRKIEKISTYVSIVTSALSKVEIQLKPSSISKSQLKKAKKIMAIARKNVNKASAVAEKLKQDWLVPIDNEVPEKK